MGAPSDQLLRLLYGGPLQVSFLAYYMGAPSDQFIRLLYGGPPQISLFAYYMGTWGPPGQFLRLLYEAPLMFFFHFLRIKLSWGGPIFLISRGGGGGGQVPPLAPPAGAHDVIALARAHTPIA